jgi:protein TonB
VGEEAGDVISTLIPREIPKQPEPALPQPRREPIRVGTIRESKLIFRPEPVYSELARRVRVSGTVVLDVQIDEEGNVSDVRVLSGHPLLAGAAVEAVRRWRYTPTVLNGEPVPVVATVTVIFRLN